MEFHAVLFDLDDTLFDSRKCAYVALRKTLSQIGIPLTRENMAVYERINDEMWQRHERGEIKREDVFYLRFQNFFSCTGIKADVSFVSSDYLHNLAAESSLKQHTEDVLKALHGKIKVFVASNGVTLVQQQRIERAGLRPYFDGIYISEQIGSQKPCREFYDRVFREIGEAYRSSSLMVGDRLSSDMQGGRNAGISTCFFGPREKADDRCDYVISDLLELLPILGVEAAQP